MQLGFNKLIKHARVTPNGQYLIIDSFDRTLRIAKSIRNSIPNEEIESVTTSAGYAEITLLNGASILFKYKINTDNLLGFKLDAFSGNMTSEIALFLYENCSKQTPGESIKKLPVDISETTLNQTEGGKEGAVQQSNAGKPSAVKPLFDPSCIVLYKHFLSLSEKLWGNPLESCQGKQSTYAEALGISERTVARSIAKLYDAGWIYRLVEPGKPTVIFPLISAADIATLAAANPSQKFSLSRGVLSAQ